MMMMMMPLHIYYDDSQHKVRTLEYHPLRLNRIEIISLSSVVIVIRLINLHGPG